MVAPASSSTNHDSGRPKKLPRTYFSLPANLQRPCIAFNRGCSTENPAADPFDCAQGRLRRLYTSCLDPASDEYPDWCVQSSSHLMVGSKESVWKRWALLRR